MTAEIWKMLKLCFLLVTQAHVRILPSLSLSVYNNTNACILSPHHVGCYSLPPIATPLSEMFLPLVVAMRISHRGALFCSC